MTLDIVKIPDTVPDDMPPQKICYAPVPDSLTTGDLTRCDRMAGHLGMHSWESAKALAAIRALAKEG